MGQGKRGCWLVLSLLLRGGSPVNLKDLFASLREGRFTSYGCYPKYWVTKDDSVLSYDAVLENIWEIARATRDGTDKSWDMAGVAINWQATDLYCDVTGQRIESAYAEPEAAE